MKNKLLLSIVFSLFFNAASAQKQYLFYLKENGITVSTKDSADRIRVVTGPDTVSKLYDVKEYYKNGQIKLYGRSMALNNNIFDGQLIMFYDTGKRKLISNYHKGTLIGEEYSYFPNGKLYSVVQYVPLATVNIFNPSYLIKSCNDTTGTSTVVNGKGYFVTYDPDFKHIQEEGNVDDGVKDGIWKGNTLDSNKISYTEKFRNGTFVNGTSADKDGQIYKYTDKNIHPRPTKINDPFFKAINANIESSTLYTNPKTLIGFWIETDGKITGFEILGEIDEDSKTHLLNALKKASVWVPGESHGVRIKYKIIIPYTFESIDINLNDTSK